MEFNLFLGPTPISSRPPSRKWDNLNQQKRDRWNMLLWICRTGNRVKLAFWWTEDMLTSLIPLTRFFWILRRCSRSIYWRLCGRLLFPRTLSAPRFDRCWGWFERGILWQVQFWFYQECFDTLYHDYSIDGLMTVRSSPVLRIFHPAWGFFPGSWRLNAEWNR